MARRKRKHVNYIGNMSNTLVLSGLLKVSTVFCYFFDYYYVINFSRFE